MPECSSRHGETMKNVDYQIKLRTIGLDNDPHELPKSKWSTNIDKWPEIGYPDIYMYLISTPGEIHNAKPESLQQLYNIFHFTKA